MRPAVTAGHEELYGLRENLHPLLDRVLAHGRRQMSSRTSRSPCWPLDSDPFLGRCLTGRVVQGTAR